ncbi:MAG: HAD hydrolase-like protein [Treponema sp.]|nr:HAD hydrolase-like protein [Treponema sp.]
MLSTKISNTNKAPPQGLIFDLDGTLFNTKNIALHLILSRPLDAFLVRAERSIRKLFAGRVYDSAESYYRAFFGELSKQTRCSASSARQWYFETYIPLMVHILNRHYHPRPGTAELLAALNSGHNRQGKKIPFAVYSDYPMTAERFRALGLEAGPLGKLYGPEDFGAQKPAAAPFLRIARELGCAPQNILVAGDRDDTDGAGAAAAGMNYFKINADTWESFRSMFIS